MDTMTKLPRGRSRILHAAKLSLLSGCLLAEAMANETPGNEYRLSVRPSICVSYDSEAPCLMSMQVSWESTRIADVCLQEAESLASLHCWQSARRGDLEVHYADSSDALYWLVDETTRDVLAQAEVVVINRDLRDSRKRRRHVWSIL
jgi:hypothetical protein